MRKNQDNVNVSQVRSNWRDNF